MTFIAILGFFSAYYGYKYYVMIFSDPLITEAGPPELAALFVYLKSWKDCETV